MACVKTLISYHSRLRSQQITNVQIRKIRKQKYKNVIWEVGSKQQKKKPKQVKVVVSG